MIGKDSFYVQLFLYFVLKAPSSTKEVCCPKGTDVKLLCNRIVQHQESHLQTPLCIPAKTTSCVKESINGHATNIRWWFRIICPSRPSGYIMYHQPLTLRFARTVHLHLLYGCPDKDGYPLIQLTGFYKYCSVCLLRDTKWMFIRSQVTLNIQNVNALWHNMLSCQYQLQPFVSPLLCKNCMKRNKNLAPWGRKTTTSVVMCNDQGINSVHIQRSHTSISTPPLLLFPWPQAFTHRSVNRSTALPTALYRRCR